MVTTYRLNTKELGNGFINSLKEAYPDQNVEIMVRIPITDSRNREDFFPEQDETEYLCSSSANREHLEKAIENVEQGKNLITFESFEQAMYQAEMPAAER